MLRIVTLTTPLLSSSEILGMQIFAMIGSVFSPFYLHFRSPVMLKI